MDRHVLNGVLLAFLAYASYALSDASIKLIEGALDPFEVAFFGAVLGLGAVPFILGPSDRLTDLVVSRHRGLWLLRGAFAVIGSLSSIIAFTALPMAEAFCLIFLLPVFVTILSVVFLKEPVGWRRWSAVIVGFLGVLIVLRPGFRELTAGHLAAIVGGFSGAVTIIILRALGGKEKRISLYGAGLIGPILVSGLLMLPRFAWPNGEQWLYLAGYGLLAAGGNVLIMLASAKAPASLVAPTQYSQMLWGVGLGYAVFGDRLDGWMFLGMAVIVGSGLFTFLRETKRTTWWRRAPPVHPQ